MRTACVSVVEPEVVDASGARPALQLAPVEGWFVGRDRELAELVAAVASGVRRIWIGGASGLGKTELVTQLVGRCRERGVPYHWLAPHEPATPRVLGAIADELAHTPGPSDRRRLLVIDDFARLRPIEAWLVERFLPALPASVSVVVTDRAAAPAWRAAEVAGLALALAPLADADARRYLARRGVADHLHAELVAGAEGIPAILAATAAAARIPPAPAARGAVDATATFYTRHDSDDHRLAIAVLVAARTTPYELLELAFDDARAARTAHAWLSRLSVVDHTPFGLQPHTVLRKACERELADHAPALWARARRAVRVFADHRLAMAHDPQRWLLDRLFVDRDVPALREYAILPAAEPPLALAPLHGGDRAAVAALAVAQHGRRAAAVIERWLDDDRAAFDVLRDPAGAVQGYLCSVALSAAAAPPDGDPALDACVAHLREIGWFDLATPPDARALVFRDWTVAGVHQAPSAGAALVLAQMAARLLTTSAVELQFIVTERPEPWQRLLRFLGLAPRVVGAPRWGERGCTVIAADWRGHSVAAALHRASEAAPVQGAAPLQTVPAGTAPLPLVAPAGDRSPSDEARALSAALDRRIAQLARSAALSPREHEVLLLLLLGRNYTEIGVALQITPRTARFHQHNVLEKIGAESRLDIVRLLL